MSYRLKRPRKGRRYYTAVISIPGQPEQERSTRCTKRRDADRVAKRLHSEATIASTRITLLSAFEMWIGLKVRRRATDDTIKYTEEKCAALLRYFGSERNVMTLTLADTTAYLEHRRKSVSDSTIAKEMTQLRGALRYLARHEMYPRDPAALWPPELPHGSGKRDRWLTWDEYLLVLAALPPAWRDHYVLYCATGLRLRELYYLRAEHWSDRVLAVPGTKTPKAVRRVPANPDAQEVLRQRAEKAPSGPLFPIPRKDHASQRAAWLRALRDACARAKVPHASTNDLRRTFCSWCYQQGVPREQTIDFMGHNSADMVRQVYAQMSDAMVAVEADKIPSRRAFPSLSLDTTDRAARNGQGNTENDKDSTE